MNLEKLIENYNPDLHQLSSESKKEVKELSDFVFNELRLDYDNFTKLLNTDDFNDFADKYIGMGNAKNKKEVISAISNVKITALSNEIKNRFINLLDVQ